MITCRYNPDTCQGYVERSRVYTARVGRGLFCNGPIQQTKPCKDAAQSVLPKCPEPDTKIDCKLCDWSDWSGERFEGLRT